MSTKTPPQGWGRGKTGVLLLALSFIPAGVNAVAPEAWQGLPQAVRWTAYGLSGLMIAAIVWLILGADYEDHARSPDESTSE